MSAIEEAFKGFTEREDIAIILINQYVRIESTGSQKYRCRQVHFETMCLTMCIDFFLSITSLRKIADKIRPTISKFKAAVPAILEIPSKEHPYDPSKDAILQRVRGLVGSSNGG